ncbi:MAG: hypothetical protein A3E31_12940 [Candidatus Rokubacteria bacterium RIFCSPHIGHO2_12_FULL_73_22]|nr:MAG: hypothetical protein A3E31_12940 [Candidatus Rokubacteria bacterium RIFCSPHIGHO2_12_FULL_73_22]OGL02934.1 MAG: hypothetical protein A3D33_07385 [Candidatus Rokubacteria bacterium RIFCSPHIGHO2_02_FULL_73_26]OGL09097.1 MAG: hypothetical protein A3I14_15195 [Candidatus Rokubacteria bacterium RIFCSPLOWO2_02_FULL_73_56]OGL27290.1 MAG: hypothetical protein A3G44_07680 [Candidatus Rokubacteria bacterium RIFCSPLOWO2_12_FULL_73_47]
MNCDTFLACLHPYVDGELGVSDTLAADTHAAECPRCRSVTARERSFRQLLSQEPRETAPPELRRRIVTRIRRSARARALRPWLALPAAAAVAALLLVSVLPLVHRAAPGVIAELVDKHIAFAQLERPAEFVSADRREVGEWFRERAGLRVTIPDYSPAGIRLVGARIADVGEHRAAYIVYEKGHTLLSVFIAPAPRDAADAGGTRVSFRGYAYLTREQKGYRTVSWTEGGVVFGLVSMLDYQALLECADRLREERSAQTRL